MCAVLFSCQLLWQLITSQRHINRNDIQVSIEFRKMIISQMHEKHGALQKKSSPLSSALKSISVIFVNADVAGPIVSRSTTFWISSAQAVSDTVLSPLRGPSDSNEINAHSKVIRMLGLPHSNSAYQWSFIANDLGHRRRESQLITARSAWRRQWHLEKAADFSDKLKDVFLLSTESTGNFHLEKIGYQGVDVRVGRFVNYCKFIWSRLIKSFASVYAFCLRALSSRCYICMRNSCSWRGVCGWLQI